jgi:hypothetical protein
MKYLFLIVALFMLCSCDPSTETLIKGDREVVQVSVGKLNDGSGNSRHFYVLRDKDTGVDYLSVVDAGIVELHPKPKPQVEK